MRSVFLIAALTLLASIIPYTTEAKPVCVDIKTESEIISGRINEARVEAINRAKLYAVEQVAGVDIKSRTIVENSSLLDDIITTHVQGVISGYKLIKETKDDHTISVTINACVESVQARSAVSALALNTSVSVFIPAKKPKGAAGDSYDEENLFSAIIIERLTEQGFKIHDIAENQIITAKNVESVFKGREQAALRNLFYRHMTTSMLFGKIESTLSNKRGEDAGYGINMPFNNVTARISYRLITRDSAGKIKIIAAGTDEANGLAADINDAYATALKNLAEKVTPSISKKINSRIKELGSRITLKISDQKGPAETLALREALQSITWVSEVEALAPGEFSVSYPENPIYLANSLSRIGFRIVSFTKNRITVKQK